MDDMEELERLCSDAAAKRKADAQRAAREYNKARAAEKKEANAAAAAAPVRELRRAARTDEARKGASAGEGASTGEAAAPPPQKKRKKKKTAKDKYPAAAYRYFKRVRNRPLGAMKNGEMVLDFDGEELVVQSRAVSDCRPRRRAASTARARPSAAARSARPRPSAAPPRRWSGRRRRRRASSAWSGAPRRRRRRPSSGLAERRERTRRGGACARGSSSQVEKLLLPKDALPTEDERKALAGLSLNRNFFERAMQRRMLSVDRKPVLLEFKDGRPAVVSEPGSYSKAGRRRGPTAAFSGFSPGDAAAATWTFRGDESRRRRGCHVGNPWRLVAATPRLPCGQSVATRVAAPSGPSARTVCGAAAGPATGPPAAAPPRAWIIRTAPDRTRSSRRLLGRASVERRHPQVPAGLP